MSSDNFDKTVFKQPMPGGDRTIMKPRPGRVAPPISQGQDSTPAYQHSNQVSEPSFSHAEPFHISNGLNPLVNIAGNLITVFQKTRHSANHPNPGGLHQQIVNELRQFETQAQSLSIRQETVLSARYLLCSALDEAVLNTPWGSESAWGQRSLLSMFHNETSGGEKFFQILDRLRQSPAENLEILELFYIFLSLGYEGKYRLIDRGQATIESIRDELFAIIRQFRGEHERSLSTQWHGLGHVKKSLTHYIPLWVVAAAVTAMLFFSYSGFRYWLYETSSPVVQQLQSIAVIEKDESE